MVDSMGMEGDTPVPGGDLAPEPTDPIKAPTSPKDPDLSGQGVI